MKSSWTDKHWKWGRTLTAPFWAWCLCLQARWCLRNQSWTCSAESPSFTKKSKNKELLDKSIKSIFYRGNLDEMTTECPVKARGSWGTQLCLNFQGVKGQIGVIVRGEMFFLWHSYPLAFTSNTLRAFRNMSLWSMRIRTHIAVYFLIVRKTNEEWNV